MDESPPARICPQCSQPLPPEAETCPRCGRDQANPFTAPASPIERVPAAKGDPRLYGAIVATIAVSIIVALFVPGLGVLFGVVLVPAAVRAAAVLKRQAAAGLPVTKQIGFLQALQTSAGVMFLVWLASTIAFTIVCFPLGAIGWDIRKGPGVGLVAGLILGFAAGLAVFVWLTRRFWPRVPKH